VNRRRSRIDEKIAKNPTRDSYLSWHDECCHHPLRPNKYPSSEPWRCNGLPHALPAGATWGPPGSPIGPGRPVLTAERLSALESQLPSEAAPRTAKSVGTPNGPCGFLSASSRRDSRSGVADRRHPLRRIGRPKPKSPSLCHPSWLVRRSIRLCGSGREERYALSGTWLKCQSSRSTQRSETQRRR
jgi:hypothetical protein